jgi:hypothetical protein
MQVTLKFTKQKQHIVKGSIRGKKLARLIEKANSGCMKGKINSGKIRLIRGVNRNGSF